MSDEKDPKDAPRPDSSSIDLADLKRKSARGGAITLVAQSLRIGIQLVSTVVLARLLSPKDYGVVAMVTAITGFAGLFNDLGLSAAAIQKRNITVAQQSNLFWINVGVGTFLTMLVAAGAPLVAWFYGRPELFSVTVVLSATFLINSIGTQHGARLVQEMQFGRTSVAAVAGGVVGLIVSIALAIQGYSYWALVWGTLATGAIVSALQCLLSPLKVGWPQKGAGVRDMVKFGANVTGFNVVNYLHRNLDRILLGRFSGADALGIYGRAYSLLMLPIQTIRGPITTVAFPALSKIQHDPEAFRRYFRQMAVLVALVSLPVSAYLFVVSEPFIELALGAQWLDAARIFKIFAVAGFMLPVASLRGVVMLSRGRGQAYFGWGALNAAVVSLGFLIGIAWGSVGIAVAYAVVNYLLLYPSLVIAFHGTAIRKSDFFRALARPALLSLVAGGAAEVLLRLFPAWTVVTQLVVAALVFLALYLTGNLLFPQGRNEIRMLWALLYEMAPPRLRGRMCRS